MDYVTHYGEHVGSRAEKFFKDTLFAGKHLMVGINCLEPGQVQPPHDHSGADKVYLVMEGRGNFTIGSEMRSAGQGAVVWAPAGVTHGVENQGEDRLVLLVGMSPPPG